MVEAGGHITSKAMDDRVGCAVLIQVFGLSTSSSYIAKAVSTTLINYAARKFIIFHG